MAAITTKPVRGFTAGVGDYSKANAGPEKLVADLDEIFRMFDPASIHPGGNPGGIGPGNFQPGAIDDIAVGDLTPDSAIADVFAGTAKLSKILSFLARGMTSIVGKVNWWDLPSTTIEALNTLLNSSVTILSNLVNTVTTHRTAASLDHPDGSVKANHIDPAILTYVEMGVHRAAAVIDHPDLSVTDNKLAEDNKVGSLANLTTTIKTNVVSAINELKLLVGSSGGANNLVLLHTALSESTTSTTLLSLFDAYLFADNTRHDNSKLNFAIKSKGYGQCHIDIFDGTNTVSKDLAVVNSPVAYVVTKTTIDCSSLQDVNSGKVWAITVSMLSVDGTEYRIQRVNFQGVPIDQLAGQTLMNVTPMIDFQDTGYTSLDVKYFPINYAVDFDCSARSYAKISGLSSMFTIDTCVNGTAISSGDFAGGYTADKAFDGSYDATIGRWYSLNAAVAGTTYIGYDFLGVNRTIKKLRIYQYNSSSNYNCVNSAFLQYWNGAAWVTTDTLSMSSVGGFWEEFLVNSTNLVGTKWRLLANQTTGQNWGVTEIEMLEVASAGNVDILIRLTTVGTETAFEEVTMNFAADGIQNILIPFPSVVAPTVKVEVFGRINGGTGTVRLEHYELWLEV